MILFIIGVVILTVMIGGSIVWMIRLDWKAFAITVAIMAVLYGGGMAIAYGGQQLGWWVA